MPSCPREASNSITRSLFLALKGKKKTSPLPPPQEKAKKPKRKSKKKNNKEKQAPKKMSIPFALALHPVGSKPGCPVIPGYAFLAASNTPGTDDAVARPVP